MSTPQTLAQPITPHHYNLDYRQRPVLNVNDRQLPPPRPSSNVSTGYYHPTTTTVPPRPNSNLSNRQYTQQRAETAQSGSSTSYSHQVPKESAGYTHNPATSTAPHSDNYHNAHHHHHHHHHAAYDDLRRTSSRASQHQRHPPMPSASAAAADTPPAPSTSQAALHASVSANSASRQSKAGAERDKRRKNKSPVDWVAFFNGKVPDEIITIHDDDSPAPADPPRNTSHYQLPPTTNGTSNAHHVDKRRRTNNAEAFEEVRKTDPHSNTNTTSADSLNNTTAPTSLASVGSAGSRLDGPQIGQKRKRSYVKQDSDSRALHEPYTSRPRGYLSHYGNYQRSMVHFRKQKDVHVRNVTERSKPADKVDDDDGHYIVHEGSNIGERYRLQTLLGQGTFGKVVRALDMRTRKEVAVKIIRAVPKYRDASRIELRVLQTLRVADEANRNRCIQLYDCFDWRGHICIVTPLLGLSVFDFLKTGGFVPFPGSQIQAFAWQLLGSIAFLHDTNLIHTDLKPENILLLNHAYQTFTYNRNIPSSSTLTARNAKFRRVLLNPAINLIDFGSATFDDEYHSSVVSTRHYRAPEIILGIGWSFPIDLWSLGCILVECWTGDALFQTHDCAEHLAMMEMVTGYPIDRAMIREVSRTQKRSDRNSAAKFFKNGHLAYPLPDTPRQSRRFVKAMKRLDEIVPPTNEFNTRFLDLLRKIFVYDPKKRITAKEALKHPWFDEIVEDDGTEATKIREERERQERERGHAEVKRR